VALRGLRRGEAVGLRWTDVDLDDGLLSIHRQLVENGPTISFDPSKTISGTRTVSEDEEVSARLGHRTISITVDTYAHIGPEPARQSAERLARLVTGRGTLVER
jgi:integrase